MDTNTNSKSRQIASLDEKFKALCEKVLQQLTFAEEALRENKPDEFYRKVNQIETDIDLLENGIRIDVVTLVLYAPKAAELRKLITYQDITNFLETIGDLLFDTIFYPVKKIDSNVPDFNYFQLTLTKMLSYAKKMVNDAIFSFCYEDSLVAYQTIADDDVMDELFREIVENTILSFHELPLNEKELANIITINQTAYGLELIGDIATYIAEAAVYTIEGTDIRHKKNKKGISF
jgi:phosphate transport system protein